MSFLNKALSTVTLGLLLTQPAFSQPLPQGQVSSFQQSKRGPEFSQLCEDGLLYNDKFLVVVDGASDKTGRLYDGHTGGWHCKETVLDVFRHLEGEEEPKEILRRINSQLQSLYQRFEIDPDASPELRFSSVLIWYSFAQRKLHALGDCKARVDGQPFNEQEKLVDRLHSELRAEVLNSLQIDLSRPLKEDPGRSYIKPLLKAQSLYQNNPEAPDELQYWVVDGTPIPPSKIVTASFPETPQLLELSSDGYAEFPQEATIEAYERELKELLREDPNLSQRVKSTKGLKAGNVSFDDRTILIFRKGK